MQIHRSKSGKERSDPASLSSAWARHPSPSPAHPRFRASPRMNAPDDLPDARKNRHHSQSQTLPPPSPGRISHFHPVMKSEAAWPRRINESLPCPSTIATHFRSMETGKGSIEIRFRLGESCGYRIHTPGTVSTRNRKFLKIFFHPQKSPSENSPRATPCRLRFRHANNAQSIPTPAALNPANPTRSKTSSLHSTATRAHRMMRWTAHPVPPSLPARTPAMSDSPPEFAEDKCAEISAKT